MYNEQIDYNKPFSLQIWKRMFPYLRMHKRKLVLITISMLVCSLIDVLYPLLLRYVIDHFIEPRTAQGVEAFTAFVVLLILMQAAAVLFFIKLAIRVEYKIGQSMRSDVFNHLQQLSLSYYNTTPVGYIMARMMSDTNKIGQVIAWSLVDVTWSLSYVIGVFIAMFLLNWKLALLVIAVVPPLAVLTVWFQKRILKINREARRENSLITGDLNEGIAGARTSKTLVIEDQNTKAFTVRTRTLYQKSARMALMGSMYWPLIAFMGSIATAFVISSGGSMVALGAIEFGMLAAFITYTVGIFEPIQQIARVITNFVSAQANAERVFDLLDKKPQIVDTPEVIEKYGDSFSARTENWEPIRGDVEFKDVTFRYPDGVENVLEHFNLKVPAGSTVAIVGETGAGKSTLVNLVCRFFEPTDGQVLLDGRDLRERSQLWLHSSIGYVLQSPHLFSGSVRENIRYGRLDATDAEVDEAARLVRADQVIQKLEKGMDTDAGEGGDRLSTGEKQLISFARAVLADPRLFILDEATSSVDTETELLIQRAISHLLGGRTSFIIAHRLSTIREADVILVVHDGKIVEQGRHEELIAKRGAYYALYTRQFEDDTGRVVLGA